MKTAPKLRVQHAPQTMSPRSMYEPDQVRFPKVCNFGTLENLI